MMLLTLISVYSITIRRNISLTCEYYKMFIFWKHIIGALLFINGGTLSEYRQLLIFGKEEHTLLVKRQLTLLQNVRTEINERDIKILVVSSQSSLYRAYKIKPHEFAVILVGKDDTEKLRAYEIILPGQLFELIDAMPMRKQEILKKKSG